MHNSSLFVKACSAPRQRLSQLRKTGAIRLQLVSVVAHRHAEFRDKQRSVLHSAVRLDISITPRKQRRLKPVPQAPKLEFFQRHEPKRRTIAQKGQTPCDMVVI